MKNFSVVPYIKNLGLICGSIIITLTFAELAVRLFWPVDTGQSWRMAAPHGQPYLVNSPLAAIAHRFQDFSTTYSINSLGNRGPEPDTEPVQVVFLGDSFTFGLFIDERDTSVGQIRKMATETYGIGQVGVVNAAIAASGIAEWIAYLQDYGQLLNPSLVVANLNYVSISRRYKHPLFTLDCDREILIRKNPPTIDHRRPWPRYRNIYKDNGEQEVSPYLHLKRWLNDHSQLFMTIRKGYSEIRISLTKIIFNPKLDSVGIEKLIDKRPDRNIEPDGRWPDMPMTSQAIDQEELECFVKASLKMLRGATEMTGGKLAVIDIGYRWQSPLTRELSIDLIALDFVPKVLSELNIPYTNLTDSIYQLNQDGMQLTIPGDGHPTKIGYSAIAKGSWPLIKQQIDLLKMGKGGSRNLGHAVE